MTLTIGTIIGSYRVTGHLATGGMGEVYRAQDTRLGRDVALKILPSHVEDRDDWIGRFEREARIVSGLNHPHILTIHEIGHVQLPGEREATHYIVTEFVDGMTMRRAMRERVYDLRRMLELMAQVADALRKAHGAGIVHRDLKPENIMFTSDGYAKVLDFGLAKSYTKGSNKPPSTFETQQGLAVGTVGYMSPEQIQARPVDHRTDVFSFGVVLYEMLAGELPFSGDNLVTLLHQITGAKAAPLPPTVDPALRQLVRRCLEKDPAARMQNMGEIAEILRLVAARTHATAVTMKSPRTRSAPRSGSTRRVRVVAVLPFTNSSGDPEMEYLSDGITESIIYALSQVRKRMRVIARNTVFDYKGKSIAPAQIAGELGATAIVTGRVQRIGGTIVVAADLVNTADGSQLWGERFQRPFSDIFEVQEQIATAISDQLRLRLTTAERRKLVQRPTRRSEAYELFLKGRYHLNRRTSEGFTQAIASFEQAVEIDPQYALAWAGIAEAYLLRRWRSTANADEAGATAERAARKALTLDLALADPHATLGYLAQFRWQWADAEREFRTALALQPDHANAHNWYSHLLMMMGRAEEALLEIQAALEIEPLSYVLNISYAGALWVIGRGDDAIAVCRKIIELEPRFYFAHWIMACVLAGRGQIDEAVVLLEHTMRESGRHAELLATLGSAYATLGRRDDAIALRDEIDQQSNGTGHLHLAEIELALGNRAAALEHVEKLFMDRGAIGSVLSTPGFAPLRNDPRFDAMLARIGFPDPRRVAVAPTIPTRLTTR